MYKVRLTGGGGYVRFEASSPVSESRVANYEGFNIVHLPTSLWAYRNTNGRHFSITGKLVSRTPGEAAANAGYLTTIRSWVLPSFGDSGAPPPIVFLTAYDNKKLNNVPCIVQSYNWTFPDDVDYIFDTDEPMPVIGVVTIELEEAYSAEQITAKAWKISPQSGGEISMIGTPGSASGSQEVGGASNYLYPTGISGNFPKLGGALTLSPGIIAKLPTMASKVVGAATNSPLLSKIAEEGAGLLNNRFISGSNPQQVADNSSVATPGINPSSSSILDSFGRGGGFKIPSFFGGS